MNPKFDGLHPKIISATQALLTEAHNQGLNVCMFCGYRPPEEQDKLFALGRTVKNPDGISDEKPMGRIVTKARAFQSWHQFGLAVDIVFKNNNGDWTWNSNQWNKLGEIGKNFGFTWGGDWTFKDFPHFQMIGKLKSKEQAKEILDTKGKQVLWDMV